MLHEFNGACFEGIGISAGLACQHLLDELVQQGAPHGPSARRRRCIECIDGRISGIDLFDHAATMAKLTSKLVLSYALDAIETATEAPCAPSKPDGVGQFLVDIANAHFDAFPAIGEGEDLRLQSRAACGGALQARGRVVHLCAFRPEAGSDGMVERMFNTGRMVAMRRRYRARSGG